jgi:hypothetical protein
MSRADREIFNEARYVSILQFENAVKSQSNTTYSISPNRKAVKLEANIIDLILQKKQLQNNILFQ